MHKKIFMKLIRCYVFNFKSCTEFLNLHHIEILLRPYCITNNEIVFIIYKVLGSEKIYILSFMFNLLFIVIFKQYFSMNNYLNLKLIGFVFMNNIIKYYRIIFIDT